MPRLDPPRIVLCVGEHHVDVIGDGGEHLLQMLAAIDYFGGMSPAPGDGLGLLAKQRTDQVAWASLSGEGANSVDGTGARRGWKL